MAPLELSMARRQVHNGPDPFASVIRAAGDSVRERSQRYRAQVEASLDQAVTDARALFAALSNRPALRGALAARAERDARDE